MSDKYDGLDNHEVLRGIHEGKLPPPEDDESEVVRIPKVLSKAWFACWDETAEIQRMIDEGAPASVIRKRYERHKIMFDAVAFAMRQEMDDRNRRVKNRAKQSDLSGKKESIYQKTADYICLNDLDAPELSLRKLAERVEETLQALPAHGKAKLKKIDKAETIRKKIKHPLK